MAMAIFSSCRDLESAINPEVLVGAREIVTSDLG